MRTFLGAVLVAVSSVAGAQVRPPQTAAQEAQQRVEETAQRIAEERAAFAKRWQIGTMHPEASFAFYRWHEAVRLWKSEKGAGAGPLLAEGVLFDCLGRLRGVKTITFREEGPSRFDIVEAKRPERAARAFDAALKIDPDLLEARMRAARIRAPVDPRAARELEAIASDRSRSPLSYLAATHRAAVAHIQSDSTTALHWYEVALSLNPGSTAAAIAISALEPTKPVPFDKLDSDDLYYTYPCTILTASAADALMQRVQKVLK